MPGLPPAGSLLLPVTLAGLLVLPDLLVLGLLGMAGSNRGLCGRLSAGLGVSLWGAASIIEAPASANVASTDFFIGCSCGSGINAFTVNASMRQEARFIL